MHRRVISIVFLVAFTLTSVAFAEEKPVAERYRSGYMSINGTEAQSYVAFLASDVLEGRDTGTRGIRIAQTYIESLYRAWGIEPMGDKLERKRQYLQSVPMAEAIPGDGSKITVQSGTSSRVFSPQVDFAFGRGTRYAGSFAGNIAFAGYGIISKEHKYNDFADLDVAGRIVLISAGLPGGIDSPLAKGGDSPSYSLWRRLRDLRENLAEKGAVALLIVMEDANAPLGRADESPYKSGDRIRSSRRNVFVPALTADDRSVTTLFISPAMARYLFSTAGKSWDKTLKAIDAKIKPMSFQIDSAMTIIDIDVEQKPVSGYNVIGYIEGSDEKLKEEYVVVGAHLDHVGVNEDGYVFNGADDNASGSSGLLEVAQAFAKNGERPKRSVIFTHWTGEEHGLWGSRFWVENPPVSLDKVVTYINMDMIGRDVDERSYNQMAFRFGYDVKTRPYSAEEAENLVMGTSSGQSPILNKLVVQLNKDYVGLSLFAVSQADISGGTDYLPFHDRKIPVLGFFTGFHEDYHKPTDTAEKINIKKIGRIARLVYLTAFEIADMEEKPGWTEVVK